MFFSNLPCCASDVCWVLYLNREILRVFFLVVKKPYELKSQIRFRILAKKLTFIYKNSPAHAGVFIFFYWFEPEIFWWLFLIYREDNNSCKYIDKYRYKRLSKTHAYAHKDKPTPKHKPVQERVVLSNHCLFLHSLDQSSTRRSLLAQQLLILP